MSASDSSPLSPEAAFSPTSMRPRRSFLQALLRTGKNEDHAPSPSPSPPNSTYSPLLHTIADMKEIESTDTATEPGETNGPIRTRADSKGKRAPNSRAAAVARPTPPSASNVLQPGAQIPAGGRPVLTLENIQIEGLDPVAPNSSTSSSSSSSTSSSTSSSSSFSPIPLCPPLSVEEESAAIDLWPRVEKGESTAAFFKFLRDRLHVSAFDLDALRLDHDLEGRSSGFDGMDGKKVQYKRLRNMLANLSWRLEEKVSQGSYGSVYKALERTKASWPKNQHPRIACIKVLDLSDVRIVVPNNKKAAAAKENEEDEVDGIKYVMDEITNWCRNTSSPAVDTSNLLTVLGVTEHRLEHRVQLWVASEWMELGSLSDILDKRKEADLFDPKADVSSIKSVFVPEELCKVILEALLKGLQQFYKLMPPAEGSSSPSAHQSINLSHVLLSGQGAIKLSDRTVQTQLDQTFPKDKMKEVFHLAPEVIMTSNADLSKADIYQVGISAIELFDGIVPGTTMNPLRYMTLLTRSPPPVLRNASKASAEFQDFVARCLSKDVKQRATIEMLLQHPFLKDLQHASPSQRADSSNKLVQFARGL